MIPVCGVYELSGIWANACCCMFAFTMKLPIVRNNKHTDNIAATAAAIPSCFFVPILMCSNADILAKIVSIFIFQTLYLYFISTK
jgi:hypothetical protein